MNPSASSHDDAQAELYLRLAVISFDRNQPAGCDRFLLLAMKYCGRAGWLAEANRCHQLVLRNNPHHMVAKFESAADALRDAEVASLLIAIESKCPPERAEFLLEQSESDTVTRGPEVDREQLSVWLDRIER